MHTFFGVVNSDQVTRNNYKFSIRSLEGAYKQAWNIGTPSYFNHDRTKLVGWVNLSSLYFEPGMLRTTNVINVPTSESEIEFLNNKAQQYFNDKNLQVNTTLVKELEDKLNGYLSSDYKVYTHGCVGLIDKDIVLRFFPELFENKDKHGLIDARLLEPILPGIFQYKGFLIFAHQYFRRSFSRLNTLNDAFFDKFNRLRNNSEVSLRVAIDTDLIGLGGTALRELEFQYWWGPKFDNDLAKIPNGVSRFENESYDRVLNSIRSTEFFWYDQDDIKTLECEEITDVENLTDDIYQENYGCRYVHSMLSKNNEHVTHLDGAIRVYDMEKMLDRLETSLDAAKKNTSYLKLWRIDGNISVDTWKELITHYYRDNSLIGEYFSGEDEVMNEFKPQLVEEELIKTPVERYIPYNLNQGDGIRLAISYKEKESYDPIDVVYVRSNQSLYVNNEKIRYIESDAYEIIKLLRDQQINIREPRTGLKSIAFEDMCINFPTLIYRGNNAIQNANLSQNLIKRLCSAWKDSGDNRIISYTLSVEYPNKQVLFSIAGHVLDLLDWLSHTSSVFPLSSEDIGDWCEKFAEFLYKYPPAEDTPKIRSILDPKGIINFKRKYVDNTRIQYYFDEDAKALMAEIKIEKSEEDTLNYIKNGNIGIAPVYDVIESQCSLCNNNYTICNCSKYLDNGVVQNMKTVKQLGSIWTNRKA